MAVYRIPYIDASSEKSAFAVDVPDAVADADLTALFNATIALTVAGDQQAVLITKSAKDGTNSGIPANLLAQREKKWLASFLGLTSGKYFTREIPNADLSQLSSDGSTVDLTVGVGAAFKAAFDAVVTGEGGETTSLQTLTFVGRNV